MSEVLKDTQCPDSKKVNRSVYGTSDANSNLNSLYDDKFDTILDLPMCLREYNKNSGNITPLSLDKLELSVRTFPIPEISIPSDKIAYGVGSHTEGGSKYEDFPDLEIEFKLDDGMQNYLLLYKWLNMLVDLEKGIISGFNKDQYSTTYNVFLLNQYKKPIGLYTFHGVIPVSLGGFQLDNNSEGNELYINFTFSYDRLSFDLRSDIDN